MQVSRKVLFYLILIHILLTGLKFSYYFYMQNKELFVLKFFNDFLIYTSATHYLTCQVQTAFLLNSLTIS